MIKKHGGIFGRNPTFNDVTVEGTLSIEGPIVINGNTFSGLDYEGAWNASTNTPTLTSSVGTLGQFYIVSVAGNTNLNGVTNWGVGDWAVFNGSVWQRVEGGADGNFVNLSVSGTAEFADGLAASPSITNIGDTNTGLYFPSADAIAIVTGGVNRVRVTSAGDVGIGTTAPGAKLETSASSSGATLEMLRLSNIGAGANTKARLNFYAASTNYGAITGGYGVSAPEMIFDINTTNGAFIWNSNTTERMRITAAGKISASSAISGDVIANFVNTDAAGYGLRTVGGASGGGYALSVNNYASGELMRVDGNGNVGIGTSSPGAKLQVVGAGIFQLDGAGSTTPLILRNDNTTSVQAVKLGFDSSGSIKSSINAAVYGNDYMTFNVGSDTERMRLDSSGNLLVGATSNPGVLNTTVVIDSGANSLGGVVIQNNTTGRTFSDGGHLYMSGAEMRLYNAENNVLMFGTNNTERMRITSTGDVGIGTTSPSAKLDVRGNATFTGNATARQTADFTNTGGQLYVGVESSAGGAVFTGSSAYAGILGTNNATALQLATNGAVRATLDTSGNVGIGTASPGFKLDAVNSVAGLARFSFSNPNAGMTQTDIRIGAGTNINDLFLGIGSGNSTVDDRSTNGNLTFSRSGTERMRIDSSGNLGLGVTPSAWSTGSSLEVGNPYAKISSSGTYGGVFTNNAYYNGGWKYNVANYATMYQTIGGVHSWHIAGAGNAGDPITFTQAMTLDASGNLGLGVTPSAWSGYKPLQAGTGAAFGGYAGDVLSFVSSNAYNDNTNWRYIVSGNLAARYQQSAGVHAWFNAASGTAGNAISFTQAMTLDASGNVQVGTTTGSSRMTLAVPSAVSTARTVLSLTDETQASVSFILHTDLVRMATGGSDALAFETNSTERMRIDASGNVGIGVATPGSKLHVTVANSGTFQTVANFTNDSNADFQVSIKTSETRIGPSPSIPLIFANNGGTERARIPAAGGVVVGTAALATTATDGFLYVPTCAGAPTGTPTTQTGTAPIVVDTTNNKLYFYSGGQWRDAGP